MYVQNAFETTCIYLQYILTIQKKRNKEQGRFEKFEETGNSRYIYQK